jgi:hypothetical protein
VIVFLGQLQCLSTGHRILSGASRQPGLKYLNTNTKLKLNQEEHTLSSNFKNLYCQIIEGERCLVYPDMRDDKQRRLEFSTSTVNILNSLEQMGYRVITSGSFVASQVSRVLTFHSWLTHQNCFTESSKDLVRGSSSGQYTGLPRTFLVLFSEMVVHGKEENTRGDKHLSSEAALFLPWHSPGRTPYVCVRYVFSVLVHILTYCKAI